MVLPLRTIIVLMGVNSSPAAYRFHRTAAGLLLVDLEAMAPLAPPLAPVPPVPPAAPVPAWPPAPRPPPGQGSRPQEAPGITLEEVAARMAKQQ